jgi:amino acid transporter
MRLSEKKHDFQPEENHSSALDDNDGYNEPVREQSLHRGLKARQISMIALGGAVGTVLSSDPGLLYKEVVHLVVPSHRN